MPKKSKSNLSRGSASKSKKKEGVFAIAEANTILWEARLETSDRIKEEYKDNAKKLLFQNEVLQNKMQQVERDTVDVISYLKKQDAEKDAYLEKLNKKIDELKEKQLSQTDKLVKDYNEKITELEDKLNDKTRLAAIYENELKMVKEFSRKRVQIQQELQEIKEALENANKEHEANLVKIEQKFFEEKMRLQQESNQKISELANKAHSEAVINLDETSKTVYKENVRLVESLNLHAEEVMLLKQNKKKIEEENVLLKAERDENELVMKKNVVLVKKQKEKICQLQEKVDVLEKSLSHLVTEFEFSQERMKDQAKKETEISRIENTKLLQIIDLKTKEMNQVKKLAKKILDQRTEVERFFLMALEDVKSEISFSQTQYRHIAKLAYQQKMSAANAGKTDYPRVRTFGRLETSTNSIFKELENAQHLEGIENQIDISELTWEQKERVLRYLFRKMNGAAKTSKGPKVPPLPPIKTKKIYSITDVKQATNTEHQENKTFVTQANVDCPADGDRQTVVSQTPAFAQLTS